VNDKLEFLIALAREQHFGRAAAACGVTQPTLSTGIRSLEEGFGVPLVIRGARYRGLTAEGERVLDWARRIAAIPTALAMVPRLTTPYRARHPRVRFTVLSRNSGEILQLLENLEIDAGVTYLDNEPLGRARAVPLYRESYRLLTGPAAELGDRAEVSWAEVARIPLCLLTPDMQNRRILDRLLAAAGPVAAPPLESNSMIALVAHVRTGHWATILPALLADTLGLIGPIRAIPITGPEVTHSVGLVIPGREPMSPLCAALVQEAGRIVER
jgi:DNA-binding transcriptional LysR family regulator